MQELMLVLMLCSSSAWAVMLLLNQRKAASFVPAVELRILHTNARLGQRFGLMV